MKKIGFIGQGWIGKNYANNFEKRKYPTVRYSLEPEYVGNKDDIARCDIVFIAVPTPTTPHGANMSIVESVLPLVGRGKIAVIKSTVVPGTTKKLQKKFPHIIVLHSPEFLSEATAAEDAAHPFANIIGMSNKTAAQSEAAKSVMSVLPRSSFSLICSSDESEIIKYAHNASAFTQIIFFNLVYDIAKNIGADWTPIQRAIDANPHISSRYANPIHKSGRGAGGNCFIKDFAAFAKVYNELVPHDKKGKSVLQVLQEKNIELLKSTNKDLAILAEVFGQKIVKNHD